MKFKLLSISFLTSIILLIMLCLGSQNLNDRYSIKLGLNTKTAELPSGFLIGFSIILGVVTGSSSAALIINRPHSK